MTGTDSDLNNASIVLRVVYGDVSFLLTGDIFVEAERRMSVSWRGREEHGDQGSSPREPFVIVAGVHRAGRPLGRGDLGRGRQPLWASALRRRSKPLSDMRRKRG